MCKQVNRALASILLLVLALTLVPKLAWAADLQGDSDVEVHVTAGPTEGWNEYDTIEWCVFDSGELVIRPLGGAAECSIETLWYTYSEPWDAVRESITSVRVEGNIHWSGMMSFMFEGCTNLVSADLSGLDTASVTNMMGMFYGCSSLQTLNLSRLDASNVTYMGHIFKDCPSLASISLPASWPIGLEDALPKPTATNGKWWSVDSGAWFTNDEIVSQRSGIADTYTNRSTIVTDGWNEYDTIEWRIDNGELVIRPLGGADECEIETSWEWGDAPWDWDSYSITSVRFEGTVHWSGDMGTMFHDCSNLASVNFAGLDTSNVADMGCMFYNCSSLTSLDLSPLDASSVSDMRSMFHGCSSLASFSVPASWPVDLDGALPESTNGSGWYSAEARAWFSNDEIRDQRKGIADTYTSTNPYVSEGWNECDTIEWRVTGGDLVVRPLLGQAECFIETDWSRASVIPWYRVRRSITSASFQGVVHWSGSISYMFFGCPALTFVNLSGLDTSGVTSMESMFGECSSLASLDLSGLDTSSVTSMGAMFYSCSALSSVNLLGLDMSSVTSMASMFSGCSSLSSLDLSGLEVSSVMDMSSMFAYCSSLASLDLSGIDASAATSMRFMFEGCSSLASLALPASWPLYMHRSGALPQPTADNGKWWSVGAAKWLTNAEIASQRKGIADTYLNEAEAIPISAATIAAIPAQTYTGKALKPKVSVTLGGAALAENNDFTVAYAKNTNVGTATVTVTGIGGYEGTATATFAINKAAQPMTAKAKKANLSVTYNVSKAQTTGANTVVAGAKGTVTYVNASTNTTAKKFTVNKSTGAVSVSKGTKAGTYAVIVKATAAGNANYKAGAKTVSYKIVVDKAANTLAAKAVDRSASAKTLKSQAVTVAAPLSVSKAQGVVTYAKAGGAKQLAINTKTGKVTVSKGTAKGTYTIKVKVTAAGNANYNKASKTVTCKVVVK